MKPLIPVVGLIVFAASTLPAQQLEQRDAEILIAVADTLPDSPGTVRSSASVCSSSSSLSLWDEEQMQPAAVAPQIAKKYARTIQAGQAAVPWGAKEKFTAAFKKQVSIGGFASPLFTAGWQQLRDGRPHYGTDSGAFGERMGAAYARQSTQTFMNIAVTSSLLHDDPRYYVLGPTHPFKSRVLYAAERVFITRKDNGGNTANIPLFVGVVSSQAIANVFYPEQDRRWSRTITGSLGSLATKMASQQFKEFSAEIRQHIPLLKKKQ